MALTFGYLSYEFLGSRGIILPTWASLLLGQLITFLLPCIFIAVKSPGCLRELFPLRPIGIRNVLMIVGMMLAIQPAAMLLAFATSVFFGNQIGEVVESVAAEGNLLLTISIIAIIPAIFEEAALRGIVLSGYRNVKIGFAALINGLFFGVMHFSMQQFLYAFVLGAIFCFLVYYTKSLYAAILSHFVINSTQAALSFAFIGTAPAFEQAFVQQGQDGYSGLLGMIIFPIVALVFLAVFVWIYVYFKQYNLKLHGENESIHPQKMLTPYFWGTIGVYIAVMLWISWGTQL